MKLHLIKYNETVIGVAKDGGDKVDFFVGKGADFFRQRLGNTNLSFEFYSLFIEGLEKDLLVHTTAAEALYDYTNAYAFHSEEIEDDRENAFDIWIDSLLMPEKLTISQYFEDGRIFMRTQVGEWRYIRGKVEIYMKGGNRILLSFDGVKRIQINGLDIFPRRR